MYQVTIKGRNLDELKKAVSDINDELSGGSKVVMGMEKDMTIEETIASAVNVETAIASEPIEKNSLVSVAENFDGELDEANMPWDKRIHAATKTKMKNGLWKYKRGLDDTTKIAVEAELKQSMDRLANPTPIPAAPVSESTPVVEQPVVAPAPVVESTPAPVPTPPQPQVNGGHTLQSFSDNLAMVVASLISEGKVTQDYINQLLDYFKVGAIWQINEEQKAELFNNFVEYGFIVKVG